MCVCMCVCWWGERREKGEGPHRSPSKHTEFRSSRLAPLCVTVALSWRSSSTTNSHRNLHNSLQGSGCAGELRPLRRIPTQPPALDSHSSACTPHNQLLSPGKPRTAAWSVFPHAVPSLWSTLMSTLPPRLIRVSHSPGKHPGPTGPGLLDSLQSQSASPGKVIETCLWEAFGCISEL